MEKKPKKTPFGIIVVMVAILGAAFFFYQRATPEQVEALKTIFAKEDVNEEFTFELGEFTLNVNEEKNYAKLNLAVSYSDEKQMEVLTKKLPIMRDIVVLSFFNISKDEFLVQENLNNQKELLMKNINEKLGEEIVKAVYITELIVGR